MRTPGHDDELALGLLFSEGVIVHQQDVTNIEHCRPPNAADGLHNTIRISLAETVKFNREQTERFFTRSSSCGVCGKTSLEAIMSLRPDETSDQLRVSPATLGAITDRAAAKQREFDLTGGLHGAALFNDAGEINSLREDVGRHNALDKLVGSAFAENGLPLSGYGVFLSGRTSFELIQKAAMAGIELVIAVGAPSSLAVELAKACNITLVGFLRDQRFNIYSYPHRIVEQES